MLFRSHLSTGDVLRAEIAKGSELGKSIDELISKGNLVPDEMMYGVIENYISSLPADCKGTIFDGYPRTVSQAESLTELLKKYNMDAIMIDLLVDEQLLIQRLIDRGKVVTDNRKNSSFDFSCRIYGLACTILGLSRSIVASINGTVIGMISPLFCTVTTD